MDDVCEQVRGLCVRVWPLLSGHTHLLWHTRQGCIVMKGVMLGWSQWHWPVGACSGRKLPFTLLEGGAAGQTARQHLVPTVLLPGYHCFLHYLRRLQLPAQRC